jgi:radical SAM-linked protein
MIWDDSHAGGEPAADKSAGEPSVEQASVDKAAEKASVGKSADPAVRDRIRIRFRKEGALRFLGHHDLMRTWERLLRRTRLPIGFTQGFHPKPRISSPLSLALGIVGLDELIEVELTELLPLEQIRERIEGEPIDGLVVASVTRPAPKDKGRVVAVEYACPLPADAQVETIRVRKEELLAASELPVVRRLPNKPERTIDVRPYLLSVDVDQRGVRFRLAVTPQGGARTEEVLNLLGLGEILHHGAVLARTRVELAAQTNVNECANEHSGKGNDS